MSGEQPARYAVFGHPVAHSRSPEIHHAFAAQRRERIDYRAIDVAPERFAVDVPDFFASGGAGANVTVPHKEAAARLADVLEPRAQRAEAVNTLRPVAGVGLEGFNTDGPGLRADLEGNLGCTLRDRTVVLLGAGGAAAGVVEAMLEAAPVRLIVANRTPERARALAERFAGLGAVSARAFAELETADVVINATTASLSGEVPALPNRLVGAGTFAYDMVYAAAGTAFTAWAEARGAAGTADGLGMLVEQAAEAYAIWRGWRPATAPVLASMRGGTDRRR